MPGRAHFDGSLFAFLRELRENNRREWFQARKARYEAEVRDPFLRFITDLAPGLRKVNPQLLADPRPVGGSLFRIYRDTRFSKDKTPYKTHASAYFTIRGEEDVPSPGFYLHLEPGASFAAAGLWRPSTEALARVRTAIGKRPVDWKKAKARLTIEGESLLRPPRGFPPEHPLIEDLKRKDFVTSRKLTDAEVTGPRFLATYLASCRTMSPLVAFLARAVGLRW
jgi:uncharacterized protein (TIGR02453 family)